MIAPFTPSVRRSLFKQSLYATAAVVAFHLAYGLPALSFLIAVYLFCLIALARIATNRSAFYFGLVIGLSCYAPQLAFFYGIFQLAAVPLWLVLAIWLSAFLLLARWCWHRLTGLQAALLVPFVWTGVEFFRSELYYLRFSWLNIGYTFSEVLPWLPMRWLGVYGIGFVLAAIASWLFLLPAKRTVMVSSTCLAGLGLLLHLPARKEESTAGKEPRLTVAGVQMEFPSEPQVPQVLDALIAKHPQAQLLVLSEYTFDGPIPAKVKEWCRQNGRYLIAGGKDATPDKTYFNTAFVIDPEGQIVFKQAKSVPIQFFADGLPAREQQLWFSPWGKIGICICYDLSYTRVTDALIRLGAEALIVPTMDTVEWGEHQHRLHARIAPVRAAEYGVPIFRVASSGVSQLIDRRGQTVATAPFPGDEAMLGGSLDLVEPGWVPLDRVITLLSVVVTGLLIAQLSANEIKRKFMRVNEFPARTVL